MARVPSFYSAPAGLDPFYSFNRFKLGTVDNSKSQLGIDFMEDNPEATWNRRLAQLGFSQTDTSPVAQFARKQYDDSLLAHRTAMIEDPTLSYNEFIKRQTMADFLKRFASLTRAGRGENRSQFVGPTRTIADI